MRKINKKTGAKAGAGAKGNRRIIEERRWTLKSRTRLVDLVKSANKNKASVITLQELKMKSLTELKNHALELEGWIVVAALIDEQLPWIADFSGQRPVRGRPVPGSGFSLHGGSWSSKGRRGNSFKFKVGVET